jgi:hypothetical protein
MIYEAYCYITLLPRINLTRTFNHVHDPAVSRLSYYASVLHKIAMSSDTRKGRILCCVTYNTKKGILQNCLQHIMHKLQTTE